MGWIDVEHKPKEFEEVLVRRKPIAGEMPFIENGYYAKPTYHDDGSLAFPGVWTTRMGMRDEVWNEIADRFNGSHIETPPVTHWQPLPPDPEEVKP